jgi:hypothetical protein
MLSIPENKNSNEIKMMDRKHTYEKRNSQNYNLTRLEA